MSAPVSHNQLLHWTIRTESHRIAGLTTNLRGVQFAFLFSCGKCAKIWLMYNTRLTTSNKSFPLKKN